LFGRSVGARIFFLGSSTLKVKALPSFETSWIIHPTRQR